MTGRTFFLNSYELEANPDYVVTRVNRREEEQHEDGQEIPGRVTLRSLEVLPVSVAAEIPADRSVQLPCRRQSRSIREL